MLEALAETEKSVAERETLTSPETRIEAKAVQQAVATADELSTEGVVKSIGELKGAIGKMLSQLSDRLEEQMSRYVQVQRAILAKETELKEIYEIQRSASTLTALIEANETQRARFETEIAQRREELEREISESRSAWEAEEKQREAENKEREGAEQKRREREKDEYRYSFAREQQQARDKFADEMELARKEFAQRTAEADRQLQEREHQIKTRENEIAALQRRVEEFPKEQQAAIGHAVEEALARHRQESAARQELAQREFAGEKNVLTTRIASLEQTAKEQAEQISRLLSQSEKAYGQVQEIAVRAIEGSGNAKQLANLQQILAEQARKGGER